MQDPVLFWNHLCNEANKYDHTAPMQGASQGGPTRSSRATAIAHLAMHDAFFAIDSSYSVYNTNATLSAPPVNNQLNLSSAVSGAAHTVLTTLYPQQQRRFDDAQLAMSSTDGVDGPSFEFGRSIGMQMLALRMSDNTDANGPSYVYSHAKPHHRADPLNLQPEPLGAHWGKLRQFAIQNPCTIDVPPSLGDPLYKSHHEEVRKKGGAASQSFVTRTTEETAIGLYWAYDGATQLGTPPRLYNQVARVLAAARNNSWADNARMFGLINAALGDAGICAWRFKYLYDLWRPVVGIREYDNNWGAQSVGGQQIDPLCDPFWRPLGAPKTNDTGPGFRSFTPHFPAYPSGHATFGAAAFEIIRQFYRKRDGLSFSDTDVDKIDFEFVSDELNGVSTDNDGAVRTLHKRKYYSLADAIYENSVSRVFLGVHWRFDGTAHSSAAKMIAGTDNTGGVPVGLQIARDIFNNDMKLSTI